MEGDPVPQMCGAVKMYGGRVPPMCGVVKRWRGIGCRKFDAFSQMERDRVPQI